MNWDSKRVTVMGLGLNAGGLGVVEYLLARGARLTVTDMKSAETLQPTLDKIQPLPGSETIQYVLGEHRLQDFQETDCIIKNPGVPDSSPYLEHARAHGVPITTDLEIFFEEVSTREDKPTVIGVTGTRGKTTTTMLIAHLLRAEYGSEQVLVGGNMRNSVLQLIPQITQNSKIILELSSFQLGGLAYSPDIAVFTNFFPDHLNRYDSLDAYFADKAHIVQYQTAEGIAILNGDDPRIRALGGTVASAKVFFGRDCSAHELCLNDGSLVESGVPILDSNLLPIRGDHNQLNALAAIGVARALGISRERIAEHIVTFGGVEGRQQHLGTLKGVNIINDTTSTMPEALYTALMTFRAEPVHLICGGNNKQLDYTGAGKYLSENVKSIAFLPGTATSELVREFSRPGLAVQKVESIRESLQYAMSQAQPGDTILFSPGATSFGQFQNEFHRGDVFVETVTELGLKSSL